MNNVQSEKLSSISIYVEKNFNFLPSASCDEKDTGDYTLVSVGKNKSVCIFDFSTKVPIIEMKVDKVTNLTILDPIEDNPIAVVGYIEGPIEIWDIARKKPLQKLFDHKNRVNNIATFLVTGTSTPGYEFFLASCDHNWIINIKLLKKVADNDGAVFTELVSHTIVIGRFFLSLNFVSVPSNSFYLVVGGGNQDISKIINVGSILGQVSPLKLEDIKDAVIDIPKIHTDTIRAIVSFTSNDGKVCLVTGSYDSTAIIWELIPNPSGSLTCRKLFHLKGHSEVVFDLAVFCSPNETISERRIVPLLVTGSFDKTINLWDTETGDHLRTLHGHTDSVTSLSIYAPLHYIVPQLVSGSVDKTIIVWNLQTGFEILMIYLILFCTYYWTGEVLRKLSGHSDRVCSLDVYTPSNSNHIPPIIVSGGDDKKLVFWKDSLHHTKVIPT